MQNALPSDSGSDGGRGDNRGEAAGTTGEQEWYTPTTTTGADGSGVSDLEGGGGGAGYANDPKSALVGSLASAAFDRVGAQGHDFASKYGRIDLIREYFDVEPHEVARRLRASLWPYEKYGGVESDLTERCDLYGPSMCVLTLGCIVVYSMQLSELKVKGVLFPAACKAGLARTEMVLWPSWACRGHGDRQLLGIVFLILVLHDSPVLWSRENV